MLFARSCARRRPVSVPFLAPNSWRFHRKRDGEKFGGEEEVAATAKREPRTG